MTNITPASCPLTPPCDKLKRKKSKLHFQQSNLKQFWHIHFFSFSHLKPKFIKHDFFLTSSGKVQNMNSQKCHFFFHRHVEDVERRILNTINVHGRSKIGVQKSFLQYFAYFRTNFCSTVHVDGIQNSPLDVLYLILKSKIRILKFHISLTFS